MIHALVALLISASAASAFQCARNYTVKAGDYCDLISQTEKVSTYQLAALNPITINDACSNLQVDQLICLASDTVDCQPTYVVVAGDYCQKIIQDHPGLNATMLHGNNPQVDPNNCDNLYIGEVLCVSQTLAIPDVPEGFVMPGMNLDDGYTGNSDLPEPKEVPNNAVVDKEEDVTHTSSTEPSPTPKAQKQQSEEKNTDDGGDDEEDCDDA